MYVQGDSANYSHWKKIINHIIYQWILSQKHSDQGNRLRQLLIKAFYLNINISSETNLLKKISKTQYGLLLLQSAFLYD